MSSPYIRKGLEQAGDLFMAAHLVERLEQDRLEKKAGMVAALAQKAKDLVLGKKKEEAKPVVKTAAAPFPIFKATGRGAAMGGAVGALVGGLGEVLRLRGLAANPTAAKAVRALHATALAKETANPNYIRSAAEHAAGRHVAFLDAHAKMTTPTVKAPGSLPSSPGMKPPSLMQQAALYAPHVARKAAGWGAAGAALGHGAEALMARRKNQFVTDKVKQYALPALGGLVGAKILLDR